MSPSSVSGVIGAPDVGCSFPVAARWPTVSYQGGVSLLTCGTAVPAKGGPTMITRRLGEEAI